MLLGTPNRRAMPEQMGNALDSPPTLLAKTRPGAGVDAPWHPEQTGNARTDGQCPGIPSNPSREYAAGGGGGSLAPKQTQLAVVLPPDSAKRESPSLATNAQRYSVPLHTNTAVGGASVNTLGLVSFTNTGLHARALACSRSRSRRPLPLCTPLGGVIATPRGGMILTSRLHLAYISPTSCPESHLSLASIFALCSSVVSICSPLSTFTHPFLGLHACTLVPYPFI